MTSTSFTSERTNSILIAACRAAGFDRAGAKLLRFGENAIYHLPSEQIVVRIGRSLVAAAKEVHVAGWLAEHGFPSARLVDDFDAGPLVVDDLPVTAWHFVEQSEDPITSADFGRVLHDLHALPDPADFRLPAFEPMPKIPGRLEQLAKTDIPRADLEFLYERFGEVSEAFDQLTFRLAPGAVHGDAHPGNCMRTKDGTILLIDLEDFAYGPREWDAAVISVRYQAFGWESEEDYRGYVGAYGFDPISWPGFPTVRAARELNMTTWLAQRFGTLPELDAEVLKRINDLRDDQALRHWEVF